jgi:hypothetical protein
MGSNKMKKTVKDWFDGLVTNFYDAGIQKAIIRYITESLHGNYLEKLFKVCSSDARQYFYFNFINFFCNH